MKKKILILLTIFALSSNLASAVTTYDVSVPSSGSLSVVKGTDTVSEITNGETYNIKDVKLGLTSETKLTTVAELAEAIYEAGGVTYKEGSDNIKMTESADGAVTIYWKDCVKKYNITGTCNSPAFTRFCYKTITGRDIGSSVTSQAPYGSNGWIASRNLKSGKTNRNTLSVGDARPHSSSIPEKHWWEFTKNDSTALRDKLKWIESSEDLLYPGDLIFFCSYSSSSIKVNGKTYPLGDDEQNYYGKIGTEYYKYNNEITLSDNSNLKRVGIYVGDGKIIDCSPSGLTKYDLSTRHAVFACTMRAYSGGKSILTTGGKTISDYQQNAPK